MTFITPTPKTLAYLLEDMSAPLKTNASISTYTGTAGTDVFASHDASVNISNLGYVLKKTITVGANFTSDLKIYFDVYCKYTSNWAEVIIKLNGTPIGSPFRNSVATSWANSTITLSNVVSGDVITIEGKTATDAGGDEGSLRNMRIIGTVSVTDNTESGLFTNS